MYMAILLVLILLIQICKGNEKVENQKNSNKASITKSQKSSTSLEKTNSDSKAKAKGPSNSMMPLRNALGHKMKKNSILTKFPMKVKSCDQIAIFSAKYITDFADYRKRSTGWFAINAHSVSLYQDKDSNKLIHHVLWANVKRNPSHLNGGKGCITIDGGSDTADISACFDSKATAKNLLKVIASFYKCRMGDNLQPVPLKLIKQLMQACGKNGKIISGKKHKEYKMSLKGRAGNKWDANRMQYHHPSPIRVPGTVVPKKKKK
jgi:hypothetical protein